MPVIYVKLEEFAKELLENIFNQRNLDYKDLTNISKCCKRFYYVCQNDNLWKNKILTRWSCKLPITLSYRNLCEELHVIDKKLNFKISVIERKFYLPNTVSETIIEEELEEILNEKDTNIDVLISALITLKNSSELNTKYYAEKIYNHLFYKKLKNKWNNVIVNDSLLKGAVLISKWCNPNSFVSRKTVEKQIDDVVTLIKNAVPANIGDLSEHSSFEQVMELVKSINLIVYSKMNFKGNADFYYDIHNSFIDSVLQRRTGIPISLGVLYIVIAKKLGLTLLGVNFPGHFLLSGNAEKDGKKLKFYLDAFNNGEVLTENQCLERFLPDVSRSNAQRETLFRQAQTKEIFIRMIANVVNIHRQWASLDSSCLETLQSSIELMLLLSPNDDESRLLLSRIYLHYGINFKLVVENLRYLIASSRRFDSNVLDQLLLQSYEKQNIIHNQRNPKLRSSCENKNVLYRVGMVMKHLRYNYICVIYGWDHECFMNEEWKMQMGIYNLRHKDKQPFYNVLVDDGSTHYVAQENIVQTTLERVINHKEIGKHFKKFNGNYYEATDMLFELFPEDQIQADKLVVAKIQL